jgi:hypothetical protein
MKQIRDQAPPAPRETAASSIIALTAPTVLDPAELAKEPAPLPTVLDNYLTPAELAKELDVSERTVHRWHAGRRGPPRILLGRKPYYKRASVAAWIEKQERDPAAPAEGRRRRA